MNLLQLSNEFNIWLENSEFAKISFNFICIINYVCHSISGKPGKYFDEITKDINCPALFSNPDMDIPSQFKEPPIKIPRWLLDDYSYHGKVEINNGFYSKTSELDNPE